MNKITEVPVEISGSDQWPVQEVERLYWPLVTDH